MSLRPARAGERQKDKASQAPPLPSDFALPTYPGGALAIRLVEGMASLTHRAPRLRASIAVGDARLERSVGRNFRFQLCLCRPIAFLFQAQIAMAGLRAIAVCFGGSDDSSSLISARD
jgi:hypothetical protein